MADGVAAPLAAVSLLRRPLALVPCLIRLPATQRDESSRAALVQRQHISTAAQLESRRREQRQRGRGEDGRGAGTGAWHRRQLQLTATRSGDNARAL